MAKASDFSGQVCVSHSNSHIHTRTHTQEKAQVKDALSRTLARLPHLKEEKVLSDSFLKAFA